MADHFEPVVNANYRPVALPTRRTAFGGYPNVACYDMLGKQLHYSNLVNSVPLSIEDLHSCSVFLRRVYNATVMAASSSNRRLNPHGHLGETRVITLMLGRTYVVAFIELP